MLSESRKTGKWKFLKGRPRTGAISPRVGLSAKVPNLAPDQMRYPAPLLSLPESPGRFHLQAPNTDASCDDVRTES